MSIYYPFRLMSTNVIFYRSVENQLTAMLIAVAVSSLVLRLPYATAFYLKFYSHHIWSAPNMYGLVTAQKVTEIFAVMNYVLNFFLYCLCGSTFRNNLRRFLHCKSRTRYSGVHGGTMTGTSELSHSATKV